MNLRTVVPVSIAASALFLAACSSSADHSGMVMGSQSTMAGSTGTKSGSGTSVVNIPTDAAFNATDLAFAQGMIVHHRQAVQMADMALSKTKNAEILALAKAIKAAQDPEITEMSGWLKSWNQTVPQPTTGMDHEMDSSAGTMMMSGMMSEQDMVKLDNASGTAFDRMFLEMMVKHHKGALEMAKSEVAGGKYQPAKTLAANVITTQQAEIDQMNALLTALPA